MNSPSVFLRLRLLRFGPMIVSTLVLAACASVPSELSGPSTDNSPLPQDAGQSQEAEAPVPPPPQRIEGTTWNRATTIAGQSPNGHWEHQAFAGRRPTHYAFAMHEGRPAIKAEALGSNSALQIHLQPAVSATKARFSWFVPAMIPTADLKDQDKDDAVVRIVLTFDGDRSKTWKSRDHVLSEISTLVAGQPLPYATLMYVWSEHYPVGTLIPNPHTNRIQQLVVESGTARLNQWVDLERDVVADFRHAFGEPVGPLTGVGIMTDSNNTGGHALAWYGPITIESQ